MMTRRPEATDDEIAAQEEAAESNWFLADSVAAMSREAAAEQMDIPSDFYDDLRRAAELFPPGRRQPTISPDVHLEAADHLPAAAVDGLLRTAATKGWSPNEIYRRVHLAHDQSADTVLCLNSKGSS